MNNLVSIVSDQLLAPGEIDLGQLQNTLGRLLSHQVDAADLYFQHTRLQSWVLEDGIIKEGGHNIEQGVGVRAMAGEKTGFAYSDEIVVPALLDAANAARAILEEN